MQNRLLLILSALLFSCSTASAQYWLWGAQGYTGLKSAVYFQNVATNITGNAYIAGSYETSIIFKPDTDFASFKESIFLTKYDPNGNVLWSKTSIDSGAAPQAYSVASDDSDNSYLIGSSSFDIIFTPDTVPSNGFLVKYDPNGNVIWAIPSGGGLAVTTDKFGHEYTTDIGGILSKYDSNGNLIWFKTSTNVYNIISENSVATDPSGDVFVSGQFKDSLTLGTYKLYSNNQVVFIAKFDSSGNVLWAQESTNNTPTTAGYAVVAAGKSGAVYLTGTFTDVITFGTHTFTFNGTLGNNSLNNDLFVVKYEPDGTIAWANQASLDVNQTISCLSVSADDSNHIYVSGTGSSTFTFANDTICKNGSSFLFQLDSLGYVLCNSALNINVSVYEYTPAVASDATGKYVYMGGIFEGSLIVGGDALGTYTGGIDPYIARWQPCSACSFSITSSPPPPICDGQSVTLTVDGAKNYAWNPAAGLSATTGDTVLAAPAISTTYTIVSSIIGCSDTEQIAIDVKPLPVFSITPPSPSICNGQYVILTASGDTETSYTWSPAASLSVTTGSSVFAVPTITTTYTVSATLNGCSDSGQIVVHAGSPVVAIVPPNPSVCNGQSILLIASGATSYVWSPSQSLNSSTGDTVVATPSIQTTYTVVGTNPGGCFGSDTDVVSIILGLNTPTITQRGDTLFSSATQGNQWVLNDTVIPGATNVFYVITQPGWYKVLAINPSNGCSTASDSSYLIPTGIAQLAINSNQLSVYPNPTGGEIFINISSSVPNIKDWSLQITDVLGRTAYTTQSLNYNNDINLSDLSDGVYFITVINKTGRIVVPVVKQN